jgi:putative drug exporter of the RND superfamily
VLSGHRIAPARNGAGGRVFAAVARLVQRRAGVAALLAAGVVLVLAVPVLQIRLGRSEALALPGSTQTRQVHDLLVQHYPNLVEPEPVKVVAATDNRRPAGPAQVPAHEAHDPAVTALRDRIAALPEVARVTVEPAQAGVTYLRVVPVTTPGDTAGARVVAAIRSLSSPVPVSVTGAAAHLVDYRTMLRHRAPWAVLVVLAGTLTLLFAFTRSVVLPVKAVLTNVLSIGAALGAAVWVFQSGHLAGWFGSARQDMTDLTVPVLVAAIAFGLSVDYEMFLLSRIRERHLAGVDDRTAVAQGLQQTGRIVTSAALLLAVVFAGFLTGGFTPIKAIGLGLALAVLLDATVVRMVLVPATMTLLGRLNWYAPRRFLGFLPVIQVDG